MTRVLLVEPHAHSPAGHWQGALEALVRAAVPLGVEIKALSVEDVDGAFRDTLAAQGCECLSLEADGGRVVKVVARALVGAEAGARTGRMPLLSRDIAALRRAILEAGLLRVARRAGADAVVVLSAGNAFPAMVVGRRRGHLPQLRVVHDVDTLHTRVLRRVHAFRTNRAASATWVTTTPSLREALAGQGLDARVWPFTTRDDGDYVLAAEREAARIRFEIPVGTWCIGLVGGWWHDKDMETVVEALERLPSALAVIVAGDPLDASLVERLRSRTGCRTVVIGRAISPEEVRAVHAASDVTVVSRRRGVVKESGLIMNAARLGVPVLFSDQDPHLNSLLSRFPWARPFEVGNAASLAAAFLEVQDAPLPRPAPDDAEALGLATPTEMVQKMLDALAVAR